MLLILKSITVLGAYARIANYLIMLQEIFHGTADRKLNARPAQHSFILLSRK